MAGLVEISKPNLTQLGPDPGSRVIVVGGCGGIGRAVVSAALENELDVAVLDLAQSLEAHPPHESVITAELNVHEPDTVQHAFGLISERWQWADHVVVLPGYTGDLVTIGELSVEEYQDLMDGNFRSAVLCAKWALPLLKKDAPGESARSLTLMSSGLGNVGNPGYGIYSAAKAAIMSLTRTLANEAAPNIRVNAVAPGGIDTAFIRGGEGRGGSEDGVPARLDMEGYLRIVPLKRFGHPDDIAGPILFLMGHAARYVTGQTIHINGGGLMP